MTQITDRIERNLAVPRLTSMLAEGIEPSDLQSLLLEVYRLRAEGREPSEVLSEYAANRFVRPSSVSPLNLVAWDRVAFSGLPREFEAIELSPVCPLGTCSAVAAVSQNWSVSTARNTEVVSDPTNVLALEAALRRRDLLRQDPRSARPVHLATSHRVVRAQRFEGPGLASHFRLFALCSAGRDQGAFQFEAEALALHIHFYLSAIRAYLGTSVPLRASLAAFGPAAPFAEAAEKLIGDLSRRYDGVECVLDPGLGASGGYYKGLRFQIDVSASGGRQNLVDGGVVDWTQRLLSNAKERLIISGIGSDRICALFVERQGKADPEKERA